MRRDTAGLGKARFDLIWQWLQTAALEASASSAALLESGPGMARLDADGLTMAWLGRIRSVAVGLQLQTAALSVFGRSLPPSSGCGKTWSITVKQGQDRLGVTRLIGVLLRPYYCRLFLYCKKQQGLPKSRLVRYCEPVRPFFMQNFAAFAVLSGMLTVLGWSYVTQPAAQVDLQAYQKCVNFHPQKFCALYHAPSKLEATAKK